ncbi:hypothetical protein C8F04DRAFT_1195288 [Mycena alexandri]|uniref:Uncharacterized protein n=1 Tax=Mycena alexandri TaxID=1745969 RepID=A0AAD6S5P4_9AGAR|nr:hypothetical protein C8F04DRAFT_1195288 [Mycena alexandri]
MATVMGYEPVDWVVKVKRRRYSIVNTGTRITGTLPKPPLYHAAYLSHQAHQDCPSKDQSKRLKMSGLADAGNTAYWEQNCEEFNQVEFNDSKNEDLIRRPTVGFFRRFRFASLTDGESLGEQNERKGEVLRTLQKVANIPEDELETKSAQRTDAR